MFEVEAMLVRTLQTETAMTHGLDVAIVGAGPAGATTALCLANRGASVALIDRFKEDGIRIGETLPPIAQQLITSLKLSDHFARAGHRPSYAIRAAWGTAEPMDQDHLFHPYGTGWHIDRRNFDRMLIDAAVRAGARLIRGNVGKVLRRDDGWMIETERTAVSARRIVDATGRVARVARGLGARRLAIDRLIGVVMSLHSDQTTSAHEGTTLVEAVSDGWWYSVRTPDNRLLIAYMTDADLWVHKVRRGHALATHMEHAPLTRARVHGSLNSPIRIFAAQSAQIFPAAGYGWIATGDAAMAVDPLSGSGICLALSSAMRTAETVLREWNGAKTAHKDYAAEVTKAFSKYITSYRWIYGCEQRFSSSEFWNRRLTPT